MQLGWANHRLKRYQETERAFLESVALDPTNANSYGALGAVYYRLGDCSRSIPMYEKAIELVPHFQGWKDGLARCQ